MCCSQPWNWDCQRFGKSWYFFARLNYDAFRCQCDVLFSKIGTSKEMVRADIFCQALSMMHSDANVLSSALKLGQQKIWQNIIFFCRTLAMMHSNANVLSSALKLGIPNIFFVLIKLMMINWHNPYLCIVCANLEYCLRGMAVYF